MKFGNVVMALIVAFYGCSKFDNKGRIIKDAIALDSAIQSRLVGKSMRTSEIIEAEKQNAKDREHAIDIMLKFAGDPISDSLISFLRTEQEFKESYIKYLEHKLDVLYWQDHCPRSGFGFYASRCPEYKKNEGLMINEGARTTQIFTILVEKQQHLSGIGLRQFYHN